MALNRREFALASGAAALSATGTRARSETSMPTLPFAADAPVSVSTIGIKARDPAALSDYYRAAVGLEEIARSPGRIVLGAGGRPLLEIEEFRSARPDDPRAAGLYHTAFLLPGRVDLARWARRAIDERIPVVGASDHLVSEAIYLTDPEGNGIEIYADRPRETWAWDGASVRMATDPLDLRGLLAEIPAGDEGWKRAPDTTIVGHVHLRVGDAHEAESWWNREAGFDTVLNFGGQAVFLSTGGYHHHVGANAWQSAGAGGRDQDRTGLAFVEFVSRGPQAERDLVDPWGTKVRITPAKV